jgi:phosphohistidine phosphatase SixA
MPEPVQTLTPEHRAQEVLALLQTLQQDHVLLVGHNPLISEVLALLTHGEVSHMHIVAAGELNAVHCDVIGPGGGKQQFRLLPHAI